MTSIPTPPPPTLLRSPERLQAHTKNEKEKPPQIQLEEASRWFAEVTFSRLTTLSYDVPAKLQDGPQCGIVASWMAANSLTNKCDMESAELPSIEDLQDDAIRSKFSLKGEMFSAQDLSTLITENLTHLESEVVTNARQLLTSYDRLLDVFLSTTHHQLILVAYDSGADQRPCNLKGHKAHWGVVVGLATFLQPYDIMTTVSQHDPHVDNASSSACHIFKNRIPGRDFAERNQVLKTLFLKNDGKKYQLIVRQSKSKRLFFFDPNELAESCCNLKEIAGPEFFCSQFVVPPGGVQAGLANQCVIVKRPVVS